MSTFDSGIFDNQRGHAMTLSREERQYREQKVLEMRQAGHSDEEIARALDLSVRSIEPVIHLLISDGRLEDGRKKNGLHKKYSFDSDHVQTIIKMRREYATLEHIAGVLGVTHQAVRQLMTRIATEYGEEIFRSNLKMYTMEEVAKEVGVSPNTIRNFCVNREIEFKTSNGTRRTYLINGDELERVKQYFIAKYTKKCKTCRKTFYGKGGKNTCSQKCHKEFIRQRHAAYANKKADLDSLEDWHRELWQRLQTHCIQKNEEWIGPVEAIRRTSLSKAQLWWLKRRRIVTTRSHSYKKNRSREPVKMYAASEMEIVRRVYAAYQRTKGASG